MKADRQLFWLYFSSTISSLLHLICMSVVWLYWTMTLNTCQASQAERNNENCGCILFGNLGEFSFKGGKASLCYFVTLSAAPVTLWSGVLALYHGYRSCCSVTPIKMTLIKNNRVKSVNTQLWPFGLIAFFTFMSGAILILLTISSLVLTIGYHQTCQQYRKFIVTTLKANGMLAKAINERLPCEVSYDLMDYLQPDPVYIDFRYRRGSWIIDSDLLLKTSMMSTLLTIALYFVVTVINVRCCRVPKMREVLNTEL